jgi:hypothetical protein
MEQSVLITGFRDFDYSLNTGAGELDTHSIFTRRPQDSVAAAKKMSCGRLYNFAKSLTETAYGLFFVSTRRADY